MNALSTMGDKRRRRTRAQILQLQSQIFEELANDHPQSIRHAFYRMTNPRLQEPVEKSDHGYRHTQYQITQMRRQPEGMPFRIPYGWITDATRRGWHVDTFGGAGDFLRRVTGLYRADLWQNADTYVEVWAESRSIAGVIEDDCHDLAVSLYPAGGFTSLTLAYEAAQAINARHDNRAVEIVFIGDYDPAGVLIDQHIEREIREHLDADVELNFSRLGINPAQIAEYDLPTKPRKTKDKRAQHVTETVEAEAMPASVLRELLRERIEFFLPADALQIAKVAERSERQALLGFANQIGAKQ